LKIRFRILRSIRRGKNPLEYSGEVRTKKAFTRGKLGHTRGKLGQFNKKKGSTRGKLGQFFIKMVFHLAACRLGRRNLQTGYNRLYIQTGCNRRYYYS